MPIPSPMASIEATAPVRGAGDPAADEAILESRARVSARLRGKGLWFAIAIGGGFVAAAVGLTLAAPAHRSTSPAVIAAFVLAYAVALRVRFEVGSGLALSSELVLAPMLFVLPLRVVPLCVAVAFVLRDAPELVRARRPIERELVHFVNCWYAFGPVVVLLLAGERPPALADWPLYLGALAAQFALDFTSSALWARPAIGLRPAMLLRSIVWAWFVDAALAPVGLAVSLASGGRPYAVALALPLLGLLAFFARERKTRIDHALELSHAYRGTALLLGDVVEADDAYTGSHSRDVVELVLDVCDELGLSPRERRDAEFAALLHDVGKIKIPAEIINKPGPLTAEERTIIDTHTIEGERLLAQVGGLLGQVGRVVRSCHERWDGGGYPDGLAGEAIPRAARIVCACDAYSAITTTRPYRTARTPAEALAELSRASGTQFDPEVVAALARVVAT